MASPKLKNLYLLLTAYLYAFLIISILLKALTSITRVLLGKWKLVIKASHDLNLKGGYINILVSSIVLLNLPYFWIFDSSVLRDVVPTHIILLPFSLDSFNYFPEPSGSGIYTAQSAVDNILNN